MDRDGAKAVVTSYSAPIRDDDGKIVGVVAADISMGWLKEEVNQSKAYKSTQRFLVTGQYHLLAVAEERHRTHEKHERREGLRRIERRAWR